MYKSKADKAAYAREWRKRNPLKTREADRRWRERHPGATRRRYLQATYGLTPEAFAALLTGQKGRCAICETDKPNSHGWCVDHCHETGDVRGVLCHSCNSGIGALQDSSVVVEKALRYLQRSELK